MDKIIIETSGLDDSSVVRLMRFCLKLVDLFKNKVVFIVENRVIKEDKPSNLIIHQITDEFIEQAEHDRNW